MRLNKTPVPLLDIHNLLERVAQSPLLTHRHWPEGGETTLNTELMNLIKFIAASWERSPPVFYFRSSDWGNVVTACRDSFEKTWTLAERIQ